MVNVSDVERAEQLAEVDRLVSLGAERVPWDYPDDADFIVLADPDGTLFCVIDLSHDATTVSASGLAETRRRPSNG